LFTGVEFGDAFNCVRLDEYFTYEGESYPDTVAHYEHQLAELGEQIAETSGANEKRALRTRRDALINSHAAKSKAAIRTEDIGRLEDYKLEARMRHQRREDLVKDKKKLFFTICENMSEVSLQKVKEHLTATERLELELNSQDPLILWNAIKATHTIVKQDNEPYPCSRGSL
jgi:hypothetical protein